MLLLKSYYITVTALAHILELHYYTIPRHPAASKSTVPLIEQLSYLRDASIELASPIPGTLQFKRTLALDKTIGIDLDHVPTCLLTILTDAGGRIITAFPGSYKSIPNLIAAFFDAADIAHHRKIIKNILQVACSDRCWEKQEPGHLLYEFSLLESVINAAWVLKRGCV